MIVKKRVSCFAAIDKKSLLVEKQVFENFGTCPITGEEGTWINGQTVKSVRFTGKQLRQPNPKEIARRLRKRNVHISAWARSTLTFLNCSSCWNRGACQNNIYAKRTYTPICEGMTVRLKVNK